MDKLRFLSLGSGSSGNCYYFGNAFQGILIDAGISARSVRKSLRNIGVDLSQLLGIFISHDHVDHIKSVGTFGERFSIPVYATAKTHGGIDRNWSVTQKLNGCRRYIEPGQPVQIGDFVITPFEVSHDASQSVCFKITYKDHNVLIATDLGYVNEDVSKLISSSDIVILEANYDFEMLKNGSYPYPLKQRIAGLAGHLCNSETANALAENWHEGLKYIFLCHLSKDNNLPDIALKTVSDQLISNGIKISDEIIIQALNRYEHELVIFEKN